jgi:hypothetical protein
VEESPFVGRTPGAEEIESDGSISTPPYAVPEDKADEDEVLEESEGAMEGADTNAEAAATAGPSVLLVRSLSVMASKLGTFL